MISLSSCVSVPSALVTLLSASQFELSLKEMTEILTLNTSQCLFFGFWKTITGEKKEIWISAKEQKAAISQLYDNLHEDNWPQHTDDMRE